MVGHREENAPFQKWEKQDQPFNIIEVLTVRRGRDAHALLKTMPDPAGTSWKNCSKEGSPNALREKNAD